MLKLSINVEEGYEGRFHYLKLISNQLRDAGIDVNFQNDDGDVLLFQAGVLEEHEAKNGPVTRPMLVYERIACAALSVSSKHRKLLARPNVIGWLKETSFRDWTTYNQPVVSNRYHVGVLAKSINDEAANELVEPAMQIDADLARKIIAAPPIHLQSRYDAYRLLDRRKLKTRKVDVCCAGTTQYGTELLSRHRYIAAQEILKLQDRATIIGTGRVVPGPEFPTFLQSAKMFVSPYGYGEYSWKDFEAIYAGCVLIKPPMSGIRVGLFDLYAEKRHHVEADLWYSNLREIVTEILDNLGDYERRTEQTRQAILASSHPDEITRDFLGWFKQLPL